MITAQDIREKCFEKARIGGYAMDEVDDFLDELANDAAASQKEIATLNAKMKYLADKIREYQGSEEAMNMALVSAQKLAKNIEEDARAKAEALVASAQKEADDILAAAKAESDRTIGAIEANRKAEELRYEKARAAAAEYIQKVRMLLDREQTFLTTLAEADLKARREGDVLGSRQHGAETLKLVNVVDDAELIALAHDDALRILADDPALSHGEHTALARELETVFSRYDDSASEGA